jgi:hypothetical protein
VDDDFSVGTRAECVTARRKLGHQRLEVVNLTVEDDADRFVLIEQRLIAGQKVDDREPAVAQPQTWRVIKTLPVRSAMADGIGHTTEQHAVDIAAVPQTENTRYAAHLLAREQND